MKKIYYYVQMLFVMMLLTGVQLASAQTTVVFSENFNLFAAGSPNGGAHSTNVQSKLDSLTQTPGWTGTNVYQAGGSVKLGKSGEGGMIQTPGIDLTGNGGNFIVKFDAMAWSGDSTRIKVTAGSQVEYVSGLGNTSAYTFQNFEVVFANGTAATTIKFESVNASRARFFIDNLQIISSNEPRLTFMPSSLDFGEVEISTNKNGVLNVKGFSVTQPVQVAVSGTGFSSTITSIPVADLLHEDGFDLPVTFAPSSEASYTGTITFSSTDFSSPFVVNLAGEGVTVEGIATLSALRSKAPTGSTGNIQGDEVYKFTGKAIVTYTMTNFNQKYIQDTSAAILIHDPEGKLSSSIMKGEELSMISGKLHSYYGMVQFQPIDDCTVTGYNKSVTPLDVEPATLDSNHLNSIQAKLIKLDDVSFTVGGNFETNKYYDLSKGGTTYSGLVFTNNFGANYIGQAIPTYVVDLTGIVHYAYEKNRIVILDRSAIVSLDSYQNESAIRLSPNPARDYVNILVDDPMDIEIYSLNGQLIAKESINAGSNVISTSNYQAGMYIVKLINKNNGAVRSSKLIVQ